MSSWRWERPFDQVDESSIFITDLEVLQRLRCISILTHGAFGYAFEFLAALGKLPRPE